MTVIWHDVECGAYSADLHLWEKLADEAAGPILDLGCGTGRVALHLARRGHTVTGIDTDAALVAAFNDRAGELPASAEVGNATKLALGGTFALALAPMQLLQILDGAGERVACLSTVASHLKPGGRAASAIVEELDGWTGGETRGSAPDAREVDGWIYSSLPLATEIEEGRIVIRRLRQTVSPDGDLSEEPHTVRLEMLSAATLEREAEAAGLRPAGRRSIAATDAHAGSTVVLLEKER